jgi:hypothetical protein
VIEADTDILVRLEDALAAWIAAKESILDAWKLLPEEIVTNRSPVPRNLSNQTLSHHGADEMIKHLRQAIKSVYISRYGRGDDPAADSEAVKTRYAGCGASEKRC